MDSSVHIDCIDLDCFSFDEAEARLCLRPGDRRRLEAFTHARSRRQFLAGRLLLRDRLAAAGARDTAPRIDANGKPWHPALRFNLSHADRLVVLASTHLPAVGVDVDYPRFDRAQCRLLAERFFSAAEQTAVADRGYDPDVFMAAWCAKEALAKGIGEGLRGDLRALDTGEAAAAGRAAVTCRGQHWTVALLALPAPYAGAVAAPAPTFDLIYREGPCHAAV